MPVSVTSSSKTPSNPALPHSLRSNIHAIEEKVNDKSSVSRFRRSVASNVSEKSLIQHDVASTEAELCQQLLMNGFILSYIDFFNLLTLYNNNDKLNPSFIQNIDDMNTVRNHLVEAEIYRRKGNTKAVFASYKALASFFVARYDWKTSIFFYEKGLEVAQLAMDVRAEMSANHELGCVYSNLQQYDSASKYHLRHEELAYRVDLKDEVAKANAELHRVYVIKANMFESSGNFDEALHYFGLSLESAKKCFDKSAEAEANGSIGNLMLHQGRAQDGLPYLIQQAQLAADLGHPDARCRASSSLAYAYDTLNNSEKAIQELTLVHTISEQDGDMLLQSKANRELGVLYSKLGRLQDAHDALQRHVTLLSSLLKLQQKNPITTETAAGSSSWSGKEEEKISVRDLEYAKVLVAICRGNLMMGAYVVAMENSWIDLLNWKLHRQPLIPVVTKVSTAP
jgi:tetratricopeptide (TPR) repeat protein